MKNSYDVRIYCPLDITKKWYVYITLNGKIVHKFLKGINKLTTYEDRMLFAMKTKSFLESELRNGWKPEKSNLPSNNSKRYNFKEAYDLALESIWSSGVSKATIRHYTTHHKQILGSVKRLKYTNEDILDFEPYHISLILDECQEFHKGSNDFYNKHQQSCKRFFREMKRKFIIPSNPAENLNAKDHTPGEKNLLSSGEYKKVFDHLESICPNYVTFLMCGEIGIRPKEARLLTMGMMKKLFFKGTYLWFFDLPKEITKTGRITNKGRLVPITAELLERLPDPESFPDHYYIFGTAYKKAYGYEKKFVPSETAIGANASNNLWRAEVKEKLGIESNQYWLKTRSANEMRDKGVDISIIRDLFGHSNEAITKIYATNDYEVRMREVAEKLSKI